MLQINTHEKLLKEFGGDVLYNVLSLEGYAGSREVVFKHLLDAITMSDRFISSAQSIEHPHKEISQEEYFDMLITEMNISLTCEKNYKKYVKDMFKEKIFDKIMNNSEYEYNWRKANPNTLEEKATEAMIKFLKVFKKDNPKETSALIRELVNKTIQIKHQEDKWQLEA